MHTKKTLFFTMVSHPVKGWVRVGNAYPSRQSAKDWLPFVRGAWRGCCVKVSQFTIRLEDGVINERSKRILDTEYNLEC